MNALKTFQKCYDNRWDADLVIGDWRGKVIGYPHILCPEEIIMASGCRPVLMTGDVASGTEQADKHMEWFFTPDIRHLYQAILAGRYEFVDLICIPAGNDSAARMFYYLHEEKRINPAMPFKDIYFLDYLHTKYRTHRDYNYGRFVAFKEHVEEFAGKKITNETLTEAIKLTNETKRLLKEVSDLRKTFPPKISGCEALPIIMSSMLIPKAEYNNLLKQFLDEEVDKLPPKDVKKARIFVSGSPIDNLGLYQLIESTKAIVVGEDIAFGDRYSDTPIDEEVDPMNALADRYTYKTPDPMMLGIMAKVKYRVDAAVAAKAEGEIFYQLQWDDMPAWDWPDQKKELEKNGIKPLSFEFQEYKISAPGRLRTRMEAFLETIESAKAR
jgi:benzoyl-CoA reductase/2-hydroxyglutaryl-CoA dehydratase subunit BcrC/BadD/HgdB